MPASVLRILGLTVALPPGSDRLHALHDVSFAVEAGEIVCLVGESGSGKSITAQTIMGLLPRELRPLGGAVRLDDEEILHADEVRLRQLRGRRMSMIFQEPMTALNPVMTCGRQIDEVLATHGRLNAGERRAQTLAMLERVHISDVQRVYDAYPHQLSGGQRQRIMIAMALVLKPALLIADEPTTALDVTTQAQILSLIRELQRERGTGVLFVTHDFGVVSEIADRVAVLRLGELVEIGTAREVLGNPRHQYTQTLMSSVPSLKPRAAPRDASAPILLQTDNLTKIYGGRQLFRRQSPVQAVRSVNLTLHRGQVLGLVGESGSGKSTLARCVARLVEPTDGRIWLGSDEIAKLSHRRLRPHRRRVQMVFQDPYRSLNPRRNIGEAMIEGPMNFGLDRATAIGRAGELLEFVRIERSALGRYPAQFSGGQRQRICIARALAMEPELLVADEAVSALDVSVQAQVLRLLDDIRKRLGLTMLFITHDLRVAAQVCDTVAVMKHGQVVEYGDVARIFAQPQNDYTRALIDAAPGRHAIFGAPAQEGRDNATGEQPASRPPSSG
ncbi:MAG TPA: ABC transporter ATP-binding protein [Xanthobacteraceae bacterium]|nr:ABC transporter ATP-binding protein [Xanthobacteraceae bacterium]